MCVCLLCKRTYRYMTAHTPSSVLLFSWLSFLASWVGVAFSADQFGPCALETNRNLLAETVRLHSAVCAHAQSDTCADVARSKRISRVEKGFSPINEHGSKHDCLHSALAAERGPRPR